MIFRRYEIVEAYADGTYAAGGPRFWTFGGADRMCIVANHGRMLNNDSPEGMHYEVHHRRAWGEI